MLFLTTRKYEHIHSMHTDYTRIIAICNARVEIGKLRTVDNKSDNNYNEGRLTCKVLPRRSDFDLILIFLKNINFEFK